MFQQDLDPVEDEVDYDLFTMEADGTHQRNLTRSPGIQDENADWSPTGHRIAFDSDRDANPELYTMRADGSDQTRLTFNEASDFLSTWSRTAVGSRSRPTGTGTSRSIRCAPTAASRSTEPRTRRSTSTRLAATTVTAPLRSDQGSRRIASARFVVLDA